MSSTSSTSLQTLARILPRTADIAFEARRHASHCAAHLEHAAHALEHLHDPKVALYTDICATVESIQDALTLARRELGRLGASSTRVMTTLRECRIGAESSACRAVANELVVLYTRNTDRYSDIIEALSDVSISATACGTIRQ